MTLGSALPWRACSSLGRIQHILHIEHGGRRRLGLAALGNLRTVSHAHLRAQPADTDEPTKPAKPAADDVLAGASLSSLIDRLSRVPIRPHDGNESVVVKPATRYSHKREDREALKKHHRALTQQLRLDKYRQQDRDGDWRAILENLVRWTPTEAGPRDLKVIIPRHSAELLSTDHERNLWNIGSRTGCDMALCRPVDEGANMDPYVILSGHPTAMSAALDDILKTTKGVTIVKMQGTPQTGLDGDQAGVDASAVTRTIIRAHQMSVPCRPYALNIRADQIPRPSAWTIEAFQQYTAALIMGHMDADLARRLYPKGVTHKGEVVRQLHAVFNDPAASAAVSLPALKFVLRYLSAAGQTYLNDCQALIDRVETLGLRMDTGIYNLVAETAVSAKNILAFECTLSQMIVHGYSPNIWTWLLFLRLVEAEEVRRYILQAMATKNFFSDPANVNRVSGIMADHDAYRAVQQGQDWDAFLAGLRELYGPEWRLHRRAATRYLDVLGGYGKFDDMRRLLEYMFTSKHGRPNAVALNTIITHCKTQRKVDLAVAFVRMFDERGYNVANETTLHLLFELARKTRKPHLLSAVWRYAHTLGMTNFGMRGYGIRLLGGQHELSQLTNRLGGLWKEPHNCKISKQEFIVNLLLGDYRISRAASMVQLLPKKGRPSRPRKPPRVASGPPSDDTSTAPEKASPEREADQGENANASSDNASTASETASPKSEADQEKKANAPSDNASTASETASPKSGADQEKKASVSSEVDSTTTEMTKPAKGQKGKKGKKDRNPRHKTTPQASSGEEPALQQQQQQAALSMSAAEVYDLYSRAISQKAQKYVPATPLGEFLQAALDCDRRLHKLVHGNREKGAEKGEAAEKEERPAADKLVHGEDGDGAEKGEREPPTEDNGVPVDMLPVSLPLAEREPAANDMLKWLVDKKLRERAAGVVQEESDDHDQWGVIDVLAESEDDSEDRKDLGAAASGPGTVGSAKADEATASKEGAAEQRPTEDGREENGPWDSLLAGYESSLKKKKV